MLNALLAFAFISKMLLHQYIASKNGEKIYNAGVGGGPLSLIWFYSKPVSKETKRLKNICNFLFLLALMLAIVRIAQPRL